MLHSSKRGPLTTFETSFCHQRKEKLIFFMSYFQHLISFLCPVVNRISVYEICKSFANSTPISIFTKLTYPQDGRFLLEQQSADVLPALSIQQPLVRTTEGDKRRKLMAVDFCITDVLSITLLPPSVYSMESSLMQLALIPSQH